MKHTVIYLAFLALTLSLKGSEGSKTLDKEKIINNAISLIYSPYDIGYFGDFYLDLAEGNEDLANDYGPLYEGRRNPQRIDTFCQKWNIPREKIKDNNYNY